MCIRDRPDETVGDDFEEWELTVNQGIHGSQDNANGLRRAGIPCAFFAGSRKNGELAAFEMCIRDRFYHLLYGGIEWKFAGAPYKYLGATGHGGLHLLAGRKVHADRFFPDEVFSRCLLYTSRCV